jgi:hypothetical protein
METFPNELLEPPRPVVAILGPFSPLGGGGDGGAVAKDDDCVDRLCRSMPARGELQSLRARVLLPVLQSRRDKERGVRLDERAELRLSGGSDPDAESEPNFDVTVPAFEILRGGVDVLPAPRKLKGSLFSEGVGETAPGGEAHKTFVQGGAAPRGILRTNWLYKHTHSLPSVVVLVFAADGGASGSSTISEPSWQRVESHIAEEVDRVRKIVTGTRDLVGRQSKIVVVIVHRSEPVFFDEKLKQLQKKVDLDSKQILLLPRGPAELFTSTCRRVEAVITDQAFHYLKDVARRIKRVYHKGHVSKSSQLALYIRHNFKLGFYAEVRHDFAAAFKYFSLAFNCTRELAISAMKRANELDQSS